MRFVRGNVLRIRGRFYDRDGDTPTSVSCTFCYRDINGHRQSAVVALTSETDTWTDPSGNVHTDINWVGSWDTSVAGPCRVEWAVQSLGALQAADEGSFYIDANQANGGCGTEFDVWSGAHDEFRS